MRVLLVLCVFACTGCFSPRSMLPDVGSSPVLEAAQVPWIKPIAIEKSPRFLTFRALTQTTLEYRTGRQHLTLSAVYKAPDSLRLEFFATNLNRLALLAIANAGELYLFDAQEGSAYIGSNAMEQFKQVLGLGLSPEEFARWFSAVFPPLERGETGPLVMGDEGLLKLYKRGKAEVLVELTRGRERFRGLVERFGETGLLRVFEIEREGKLVFQSSFQYREGTDEVTSISFALLEKSLSGKIEFSEFIKNPDLGATTELLFKTLPPPGMPVIDLDGSLEVEEILPF